MVYEKAQSLGRGLGTESGIGVATGLGWVQNKGLKAGERQRPKVRNTGVFVFVFFFLLLPWENFPPTIHCRVLPADTTPFHQMLRKFPSRSLPLKSIPPLPLILSYQSGSFSRTLFLMD